VRTGAVIIEEPVVNIDTDYDLQLADYLIGRQIRA
jgi:hypothetical protein